MPLPSFIGCPVEDVATPALLVDKAIVQKNCLKMLNLASKMNITLRGQTKTHKTLEGALMQTGGTKRGLVVSTLAEAEFFAEAGFEDILYGYPLMEHHMARNFNLAQKLNEYHVMIANDVSVDVLMRTDPPVGKKWSVFIKLDCGNARCGVPYKDTDLLFRLARRLQSCPEKLDLRGIYVHCGNSYAADSVQGVEQVRDDTIDILNDVAAQLRKSGIEIENFGIGSTPSCSHEGPKLRQLTEIHPGNYVFYDLQQCMLRSCSPDEIACVVMTRVVGHYPHRKQILIDAGFLGLSDQGFEKLGGSYASVKDFPNLRVVKMTQEIGFVECADDDVIDFDKLPIGKTLFLYQYHSCDMAAKFPVYYVYENGVVVEEWSPIRGW